MEKGRKQMGDASMDDTMVTFDTKEEADRFRELTGKIAIAIEETNCTYREVMRVIDVVKRNYEKKGSDLLNDKSIKEVASYKALLD